MERRIGTVLAALLGLSACIATPSQVLGAPDCGIFEGLKSKIGADIVGNCLPLSPGDPDPSTRQTTKGLFVWEGRIDPSFTDGNKTWVLGPYNTVYQRLNTDPLYDWEETSLKNSAPKINKAPAFKPPEFNDPADQLNKAKALYCQYGDSEVCDALNRIPIKWVPLGPSIFARTNRYNSGNIEISVNQNLADNRVSVDVIAASALAQEGIAAVLLSKKFPGPLSRQQCQEVEIAGYNERARTWIGLYPDDIYPQSDPSLVSILGYDPRKLLNLLAVFYKAQGVLTPQNFPSDFARLCK